MAALGPALHVTAKVDYAVRACVELAANGGGPLKRQSIAVAQDIPLRFLENICSELRSARIVRSRRGQGGGYWLARPAEQITLADVIEAVEGPASVRSEGPREIVYEGSAVPLRDVWLALDANMQAVLEEVTPPT